MYEHIENGNRYSRYYFIIPLFRLSINDWDMSIKRQHYQNGSKNKNKNPTINCVQETHINFFLKNSF